MSVYKIQSRNSNFDLPVKGLSLVIRARFCILVQHLLFLAVFSSQKTWEKWRDAQLFVLDSATFFRRKQGAVGVKTNEEN